MAKKQSMDPPHIFEPAIPEERSRVWVTGARYTVFDRVMVASPRAFAFEKDAQADFESVAKTNFFLEEWAVV